MRATRACAWILPLSGGPASGRTLAVLLLKRQGNDHSASRAHATCMATRHSATNKVLSPADPLALQLIPTPSDPLPDMLPVKPIKILRRQTSRSPLSGSIISERSPRALAMLEGAMSGIRQSRSTVSTRHPSSLAQIYTAPWAHRVSNRLDLCHRV